MHFDNPKKSNSNLVSFNNENKLSKSELSEPSDGIPSEDLIENKEEKVLYQKNETEFPKSAPKSPQTSYFLEANSILQEVKSKFLPKGAKFEKVSKKRP